MVRPDDCSLSARPSDSFASTLARRWLRPMRSVCSPTPVNQVMAAAKVFIADEDLSDEVFLRKMRRHTKSAGHTLKRALDKILGVLHVAARLVYLDKVVHVAKLPFLKLHETAHAVLPWQKDIYAVTEECSKTLAPEIADEFEKDANVASVLHGTQLGAVVDHTDDKQRLYYRDATTGFSPFRESCFRQRSGLIQVELLMLLLTKHLPCQ